MTGRQGGDSTVVVGVEDGTVLPLSIQQRLLLDWAKELYTKSVDVSLEYCKTMAAASVAAIALYYGLFAFVVADDWIADSTLLKLLVAGPAFLFLVASWVFSVGVFPKEATINLNDLDRSVRDGSGRSAEQVRTNILDRIRGFALLGTIAFAAALILGGGCSWIRGVR